MKVAGAADLLLGRQIHIFLGQDVGQLRQGSFWGQVSACYQPGVDQHLGSDRDQR